FITLVTVILILSAREWILLISQKREPQLMETPPVWLPDYAVSEKKSFKWLGWLTLFFLAIKEISGQSAVEREEKLIVANEGNACQCGHSLKNKHKNLTYDIKKSAFLSATDHKYKNINRCC
ncbi:MAG TPA: hypothetical protein PLW02_08080, partial [Verrucomicrobiota bacterium]|nr:hypothetical protein [Verrucomicrobiota bacterium]